MRAFLTAALTCCTILITPPASGDTLMGIAVDDVRLEPVHGALIAAAGPSGASGETKTNEFGIWAITDLPAGDYTITATHPSFQDKIEDLSLAGSAALTLALRPKGETEYFFDLDLQVMGVRSNLGLPGATVLVTHHILEHGPVDQDWVLTADNDGRVTRDMLPAGHYSFHAEHRDWDPLQWPADGATVFLDEDHAGIAALKPSSKFLLITVEGYDPTADIPVAFPLKDVFVEITGYDWTRTNPVIPTRVLRTNIGGEVFFQDIAAIEWEIRVKKPGYLPTPPVWAEYDPVEGLYPWTTVQMTLNPDTGLVVFVDSPYQDPEILAGATVRVEGEDGTATEGINRWIDVEETEETAVFAAIVENLLPGRYHVRIQNQNQISIGFRPAFPTGQTVVEVADGETASVDIDLTPHLATVTGRLVSGESALPSMVLDSNVEPLYVPVPNQEIHFISSEVEGLLRPDHALTVVTTDSEGRFEARLIPSYYGIQIPDMMDHYGHQVDYQRIIVTDWGDMRESGTLGWPYPYEVDGVEWGHPFISPGVPLHSMGSSDLTLRVHRQFVDLLGQAWHTGDDPFVQAYMVRTADEILPYTYGTTDYANAPQTIHLEGASNHTAALSTNGWFRFSGVLPGDYQLRGQHQDFDFYVDGGGTTMDVSVPSWDPPGFMGGAILDLEEMKIPARTYHVYGPSGPALNMERKEGFETPEVTCSTWNVENQEYELSGGCELICFTSSSHPNQAFPVDQGVPALSPYTLYISNSDPDAPPRITTRTRNGDHTYEVAWGGPSGEGVVSGFPPCLATTYKVSFQAYQEGGAPLAGLHLGFANQAIVVPSGGSIQASVAVQNLGAYIQEPEWSLDGAVRWTIADTSPLHLHGEATVTRQMAIYGKVLNPDLTPAVEAKVTVFSRFGKELGRMETDEEGAFQTGVPHQPIFLEVWAPGHYPVRTRRVPNTGDGLDIHDADFTLQLLPAPTVDSFLMNRYGLFLPGVLKAGDTEGWNAEYARPSLTCTWTVSATPAPIEYTWQDFDTATGPGEERVVTLEDTVERVILVDDRQFAGSTGQGNEAPLSAPEENTWLGFQAYLNTISRAPEAQNDPYKVFISEPGTGEGGVLSGELHLWELPAGVFTPRALVFTRRGAVGLVEYETPEGKKPLQGIPLPPWAGSLINLIGSTANATGDYDVGGMVPKGNIMPMPNVNATIGDVDGYVNYGYEMGVTVTEGTRAPSKGLLSMGGRLFGLSMGGKLSFTVLGKDGWANLAASLALSKDFVQDGALHLPAFLTGKGGAPLKPAGPVELKKLTVSGSGSVAAQGDYSKDTIPIFALLTSLSGSVDVGIDLNPSKYLATIPYVGLFILAAEKSGVAQFRILVEMLMGGTLTTKWSTELPPSFAQDMLQYSEPQPQNFLGGLTTSRAYTINWRAAAGIRATALWKWVEAFGKIQFGQPTDILTPGVKMVLNTLGEWPPVKRVVGAVSLVAGIKVGKGGVALGRTFQYDLIRVDWQLNTEPFFDLVPTGEQVTVFTPFTVEPATWVGEDGNLVSGLYTMAITSAASDGALVFTLNDPATGGMKIMLSTPEDGVYSKPVSLADAGIVLGLATERLADGRLLVAWTRIPVAAMGTDAAATLHALVVAPEGQVSEPEEISGLSGNLHDLRLATVSDGAVLALVSSAPDGDEVLALEFDGAAWRDAETIHGETGFTALKAASTTDEASLGLLGRDGEILLYTWRDPTWEGPETPNDEPASTFALEYDDEGVLWVLAMDDNGILTLLGPDENRGWAATDLLSEDLAAVDVALLPMDGSEGPLTLVAWAAPGADDRVRYGFVDEAGGFLEGPEDVPIPSAGRSGSLVLLPLEGEYSAGLLVRTEEGFSGNLDGMKITLGEGPAPLPAQPGPVDPGVVDPEEEDQGGKGGGCTASPTPAPLWPLLLLLLAISTCCGRAVPARFSLRRQTQSS